MSARMAYVPIEQIPLFSGLSQSETDLLLAGSKQKLLKHKESFFKLGDPAQYMGVVLSGAMKLSKMDDRGGESIVHFLGVGDIIGSLLMSAEKSHYPLTCASIGKSMVLKIPKETYVKSWANHIVMQQRMNQVLYHRMSQIQEDKVRMRMQLGSRVAVLLFKLIEKYSEPGSQQLPIPITRQEIADTVGSSVESVIRLMSEWSQKGIITVEDRQINVQKPEVLVKLAEGDLI